MNLMSYKTFNNKQGPPGNVFKTRIYFVSHPEQLLPLRLLD